MNQSKKNDPRFWARWKKAGALGRYPRKLRKLTEQEKIQVAASMASFIRERMREQTILRKIMPVEQIA
jgi:hypothetical protein